jgi:FKBP-type peptidyl-prolyl cis-trans isomerase
MYSIIIVAIAIGVVAFMLKKADAPASTTSHSEPVDATNTNQTQPMTTETQNSAGSELTMTITKAGSGQEAKDGDTLSVNYSGYLADGTKFDSSIDRGMPFEFTLGAGMVIPGWDIGIKGMKVGESRKLVIPAKYAYGEKGFPGVIPENATLTFDVDLLDIKSSAN